MPKTFRRDLVTFLRQHPQRMSLYPGHHGGNRERRFKTEKIQRVLDPVEALPQAELRLGAGEVGVGNSFRSARDTQIHRDAEAATMTIRPAHVSIQKTP